MAKSRNGNKASMLRRILLGGLLLALGGWLTLSFFGFHSRDYLPGEIIYPPPRPVHNYGGPAGAMAASVIFSTFGYLGIAVPVLFLILGIARIFASSLRKTAVLSGELIAGQAILASLLALPGGDFAMKLSGKYGLALASALKSAVGNVGAYILNIAIFLAFLAVLTRLDVIGSAKAGAGGIRNAYDWLVVRKRKRDARKNLARERVLADYESRARRGTAPQGITGSIIPGEIIKEDNREKKELETEEKEEEPAKTPGRASRMEVIFPPMKRRFPEAEKRLVPEKQELPPPPPPAETIDPKKLLEDLKREQQKEIVEQKPYIAPAFVNGYKNGNGNNGDVYIPPSTHFGDSENIPPPIISHEPPLPEPVPPEVSPEEKILEEEIPETEIVKHDAVPTSHEAIVQKVADYKYTSPPIEILVEQEPENQSMSEAALQQQGARLMKTLESFGVKGFVKEICPGPVITRYEVEPAEGVKVSRISNLADDIALALKAQDIRIIAPVPGKGTVGIEVPNEQKQIVRLKPIIASDVFRRSNYALPMALGKRVDGSPAVVDLAKMPHLLIAGATGSGKSVCINSIITSLVYALSPVDVRFFMIDPKRLELSVYKDIPHLAAPIVVEPKHVAIVLNVAVTEMEERYKKLSRVGVRSIADYNALAGTKGAGEELEKLPYIVIVVDELADLMALVSQEIEEPIARIAQMARAVGIHLIIATQRPSVDVVTGLIKANFPSRIAFKVRSKIDSRTILDMSGAERLLGHGDMLYLPSGYAEPIRIHGNLITTPETERIVNYLRTYPCPTQYMITSFEEAEAQRTASGEEDELFWEAAKVVVMYQQGSTSFLQRKLRVGYTRAGSIVDQLESAGVLGPFQGSKAREVLIKDLEALDLLKSDMEG